MKAGGIAIVSLLCVIALVAGAWAAVARQGAASPAPAGNATWDPADPLLGRKAYAMCQGCHGVDGRGVPGYAPALAASSWLNGDARAAALIVLHGYDATSEPGAAYVSSRMLGHGHQLADHEVSALLTWARSQWGNRAPAVGRELVTGLRTRTAGRTAPWTPAELRAIIAAP